MPTMIRLGNTAAPFIAPPRYQEVYWPKRLRYSIDSMKALTISA